ncbi:MAG: hypothetical protein SGBAC_007985 [Bacillariaceae sp.]
MTASIESSKYAINMSNADIKDYDTSLLHRLGGEDALEAVLKVFFEGILKDDLLLPFFENTNPALIKIHQKQFLSLAFTEFPAGFDPKAYLIERHYRLFRNGLNETHFDRVVVHLEAALSGMWVDPRLISEVKGHLGPLRAIFADSNRAHRKKYLRDAIGSCLLSDTTKVTKPKPRPKKFPKLRMGRFLKSRKT